MVDSPSKNSDKQRSTSPDGGDGTSSGGGFQGFYGYTPNEGANADGSPFFPFPGAVYQAFPGGNGPPGGLYPVNMSQLAASSQYAMHRQKRKQVKNACVNCAAACKKCDNQRPCERCKKYGIGEACVDSARKERKKGVKRGPYKRRHKPGQIPQDGEVGQEVAEGEWIADEDGSNAQPTTVDPADLPNSQSGAQAAAAAYSPPEGFYTYPYPYPFPPTQDGQPPEGFPPPPFFPHHLGGGYPPYPPWGHPPFEVAAGGDEHGSGSGGGSARTSGTKKKRATKDQKKASEEAKAAAQARKGETAAARASRAARRSGGGGSGGDHGQTGSGSGEMNDMEALDMSAVTDPSLLTEHHEVNGDGNGEPAVMSLDPQATTKS